MGLRIVSSTIYDLEGQPLINRSVTIELLNASYAPEGVYVPSRETYRTDETGKLEVTLWANEGGDIASLYRATFPGGDTFTFTLPEGAGPLTWSQVRALGVVEGTPQYQTLVTFIRDNPTLTGASAYKSWLAAGNVGTEAQFLASLIGPPGTTSWLGITDKPLTFTPSTHTHPYSEISGKPATFPPDIHAHVITDVTGLQVALDGKAAITHTHAISDTTGLQVVLDGKSPVSHTHAIENVTGLQTILDGKEASGTAAAAVNAHVLEVDPHPQYQREVERGQAGGYASLGTDAKVPLTQLKVAADFSGINPEHRTEATATERLNAALTAAGSTGRVVLPQGYVLETTAALSLPSGAKLHAVGAATIRAAAASIHRVVDLLGKDGVEVKGVTFDANRQNRPGVTAELFYLSTCDDLLLDEVTFLNSPREAFWQFRGARITLRRVKWRDCSTFMRFDGGGRAILSIIEPDAQNLAALSSYQGFQLLGVKKLLMTAPVIEGIGLVREANFATNGTQGSGLYATNCEDVVISEARISRLYWSSMVIGAGCKRVKLINAPLLSCSFNEAPATGLCKQAVWVEGSASEYVDVTGNLMQGALSYGDGGGGTFVKVKDNLMFVYDRGIDSAPAGLDADIVGNTIRNLGAAGAVGSKGVYFFGKTSATSATLFAQNKVRGFERAIDINNTGGTGTTENVRLHENDLLGNTVAIAKATGVTLGASCKISGNVPGDAVTNYT